MKPEVTQLNIEDFSYSLPDHRIARYPLPRRDHSKLLITKKGHISEDVFYRIGSHLPENAFLVSNETRVIQARLFFKKSSGALIELLCLEPVGEISDLQMAFSRPSPVVWKCLVGNAKRWKNVPLQQEVMLGDTKVLFAARLLEKKADHALIEFSWDEPAFSFAEILSAIGKVPLPPYLNRPAETSDKENYQTVYAKYNGSVAAPTAGLHFTRELIESLEKRGVVFGHVTLHVGAGTFRPVSSETIGAHEMHDEKIIVSKAFLNQILAALDTPIISVGTTSMRTIESLYWLGCLLSRDKSARTLQLPQWTPYQKISEKPLSARESLLHVLDYLDIHQKEVLTASTSLLIAPGYEFKIVNGLITNFHQPKSTLLLLVAALIGEQWKRAYQYALEHDFRFLSYGDSCLFLP